jgi:sulfur carrier protein
MRIYINDQEKDTQCQTLNELLTSENIETKGIAVAANNKLVPKAEWENFALKENDKLIIIKAACGG